MEYLIEGDIVQMCLKQIISGYEKFIEIGVPDKIIFDPGFGFSKSYNQNWDLLNRFDELNISLVNHGVKVPWLIGISKKSFLRKSLVNSSDPFSDSEIIHANIIKDLVLKKLGHIIFRAHDPKLVLKSMIN
jgi:dihydropteroate synthase